MQQVDQLVLFTSTWFIRMSEWRSKENRRERLMMAHLCANSKQSKTIHAVAMWPWTWSTFLWLLQVSTATSRWLLQVSINSVISIREFSSLDMANDLHNYNTFTFQNNIFLTWTWGNVGQWWWLKLWYKNLHFPTMPPTSGKFTEFSGVSWIRSFSFKFNHHLTFLIAHRLGIALKLHHRLLDGEISQWPLQTNPLTSNQSLKLTSNKRFKKLRYLQRERRFWRRRRWWRFIKGRESLKRILNRQQIQSC